MFDAKLEYDLIHMAPGSLRSMIADPMRKNPLFKRIPTRPVSSVRPIVQVKMEEPLEAGAKKTIKVTPFFRRATGATSIRLPRHLLGTTASTNDFRKLLSETAKAEMAQPLNLNPPSVGIKVISNVHS